MFRKIDHDDLGVDLPVVYIRINIGKYIFFRVGAFGENRAENRLKLNVPVIRFQNLQKLLVVEVLHGIRTVVAEHIVGAPVNEIIGGNVRMVLVV